MNVRRDTPAPPNPAPDRAGPDRAEQAFVTIVDNAPDAIARLSRSARFLYVNQAVARLVNRTADALVGCRLTAMGLPLDVLIRYRRAIRTTFRDGSEVAFDFSVDAPDRTRHLAVRIVPEFDDDGRVGSALAVTYDITQRTEAERERDVLLEREQAARAKAEAASHARDQFLAIVSHELRSPLNGIQSWSHVLENQFSGVDRGNPLVIRALEGIRAGVEQQVALIEHLLDATVATTGQLRLVRGSLVLRESIESAVLEIRASAIDKDVALHVDMRLRDERIDGDPHRVRQVFGHLLSNALKFTPKGGSIWLSARPDGDAATIVVRDSGRGLTTGFEHWLFEPFRQADSSNTRRAGGIGLGLALARRIAELHGGRIVADSAGPHLGATFTVTLPLEARAVHAMPAATTGIAQRSVELAGVHAVVIDDQLEAREALRALLTQFGARVEVAASSQAALELIDRQPALPHVVICDIAMPEEDGYGFLRRLRAHEVDRASHRPFAAGDPSSTPVIALSAFAEPLDRPVAAGAGFDFYLAKPVSPQQLLVTLSRIGVGDAAPR